MANYTFHCLECGECTEWPRSTEGNKEHIECPTCYNTSKRFFIAPIVFRMNSNLSNKVVNGMERQLMENHDLLKDSIRKVIRKSHRHVRPWHTHNYKL